MLLLSESGVSSDNEDDDDEGDGSYLHPSLFASKKCSRLEELMKVYLAVALSPAPRQASAGAAKRARPLAAAALCGVGRTVHFCVFGGRGCSSFLSCVSHFVKLSGLFSFYYNSPFG